MHVIENESIKLDIAENDTIKLDIAEIGYPVYPDNYKGSYTVTPINSKQVLKTAGLMASEDIIIEKIPDEYGLITWNGSFLRVS